MPKAASNVEQCGRLMDGHCRLMGTMVLQYHSVHVSPWLPVMGLRSTIVLSIGGCKGNSAVRILHASVNDGGKKIEIRLLSITGE